jgi:transposase
VISIVTTQVGSRGERDYPSRSARGWWTVVVDADAARIAELEIANAALLLRIVELEAFVALLLDKITVLERLVKGDSSNSSRPPSSDGATAKNKRPIANGRNLNKGAKRMQGKQPGAPGASLKPRAVPDLVVVHEPSCWRGCGAGLGDAVTVGGTSRQVFDIANPTVYVTEHCALRRRCSCGSVTAAGCSRAKQPPQRVTART